jgi:hypothetical protein
MERDRDGFGCRDFLFAVEEIGEAFGWRLGGAHASRSTDWCSLVGE